MDADRKNVLLVSSEAKPEHWVLPKGGAENDETNADAALRETWEEAGAHGTLGPKIGVFYDYRPSKDQRTKDGKPIPRTECHFYELYDTKLEPKWPESDKRRRKWMPYEEAKTALLAHNRTSLAEALEKSSLGRTYGEH